MSEKIRVGIVGASPARGWAVVAHLPALKDSPDYEIQAVSTTNLQSAAAGAAVFAARHAFDNFHDLVTCPDVDLVVVTIKVPNHYEVVMAALAAGKMVFCEWPLGATLQEAEVMASEAAARNVPTMIGLQTRLSPQVHYLKDLVADGYLGKILGTAMTGSAGVFDGKVEASNAYLVKASSGATLLSIPAAHAVDALCFALGEFVDITATMVMRHTSYIRVEDQALLSAATPDQIAFSGVLESGALAAVYYRGGASRGPDFVWEINGTEGDIILSVENGRLSSGGLSMRGGRGAESMSELAVPRNYQTLSSTASVHGVNVAGLYAQFANDRRTGIVTVPDFAEALKRQRLINAIERAQETGIKQITWELAKKAV